MRDYRLRLDKNGISPERYKELLYICRQYEQYKRRVREICGEICFVPGEAVRQTRGGNGAYHGTPDPTARDAIRAAESFEGKRIAAIERAAILAAPGICQEILQNVTRGVRFEEMRAACGRRYFFEARRRFFVELDQLI